MGAAAAFTCSHTAEAMVQHADVSLITYTDFGQNMGRYAVGNINALLNHIRKSEEGVTISYTGGQATYTLQHGMVDFSAVATSSACGASTAIGYNFIATVKHNGVQNPTFSASNLADGQSIRYQGIELRNDATFLLTPNGVTDYNVSTADDYKITRLSKIVTDVTGATVYGSADGNYSALSDGSLVGQLLYHAGAGAMYLSDGNGSTTKLTGAYLYITGGITTIASMSSVSSLGSFTTRSYFSHSSDWVSEAQPLPYFAQAGDSGSPVYIWNENTQQYEFFQTARSISGHTTYSGNCEWTADTMDSYSIAVSMGGESGNGNMIYLGALDTVGETIEGSTISATPYSGSVTNSQGEAIASYNGVQSGINLWLDLSELKDTQNWYNYGSEYLNASQTGTSTSLTYADIFNNNNLVIAAESSSDMYVTLNDTVDLGVGYVQFSKAEGVESANFIVEGIDASSLLNSAGYVVDEGVSVHLNLTNPADYMREWRKVGAGTLCIEGSGNNDIFLNVGGSGATILNREDGYAAYNVLANNGSTVVIRDINQIARDFTFGYQGGVLDMNGNSMEWNNDNSASAEGFTINALDEQATITNTSGTTTLTWTQGGEQTWLGSFVDTEAGALTFIYNGGEDGHLSMHSIHTDLSHASGSGMEVQSGTVTLVGTNTVHGTGSDTGTSAARYTNADDWHYADAAMNVTVNNGATFELGSHARLTGDVAVQSGGTYIMREGVTHQMEYIEGGQVLEDTNAIRAYFGHKGNVSLESGARMEVAFSEDADSTLVYDGVISGAGAVSVSAQNGIFNLTNENNSFSGEKEIISGGVRASTNSALGDIADNKWLIGEQGWLASDGFTQEAQASILNYIDGSSTGVLALTSDISTQFDLTNHEGLIIGAIAGQTVHYGTADTELNSVNGQWTLGGAGGELVVDFLLTGEGQLVLGNEYGKGSVHLTNTGNNFTGGIIFAGGVTFTADEGAMGNSMVELTYSNRLMRPSATELSIVNEEAEGVLLTDTFPTADIDLTAHSNMTVGSKDDCRYTGTIILAGGADYHFGGSTGIFTVASELEAGRNVIIDGQTYEGGTVVLANAQAVNGSVTVMGRDADKTDLTEGTATLGFESDNALGNVSSFSVKDGGAIDLMGTAQKLNLVTIGPGGTLSDSSAGRSGVVTLSGDTTLAGELNVATVIKDASGNLTLGGTSSYDTFEVQGGTVTLASDTATASGGTLILSNATLNQNGYTVKSNLTLGSGTTVENFAPNSGTIHVQGDSTINYASGNTSSTLSNTLTVDAGSTLSMNPGTTRLSLASLAGGGALEITTQAAHFQAVQLTGDNSAFSGHLTINGTGTTVSTDQMTGLVLNTYASSGTGTITLNNSMLRMSNANTADTAAQATLDIASGGGYITGTSGKTYYYSGLSGSGALKSGYYSGNVGVWFQGDVSQYTGNITLYNSTCSMNFGGDGINYHTVTGTSGTDAVNLFGSTININAVGGTLEFRYADKVNVNANLNNANVVHSGSGTLIFGESGTIIGNLEVGSGTVQLGNGVTVSGTVSISDELYHAGTLINANTTGTVQLTSEATLECKLNLLQGSNTELLLTNKSYNDYQINGMCTLAVSGAEGAQTGATLTANNLIFNDGGLSFSGDALFEGAQRASLELNLQGGISALDNYVPYLQFSDTTGIKTGTYWLASGDWSGMSTEEWTVDGISDYLSYSLTTSDSGLYMELSYADNVQMWLGEATANTWDDSTFGTSTADLPNTDSIVVFTDAAASHSVNIAGTLLVSKLTFDAKADDYALTAAHDGSLSATSLEVCNGTVSLGEGISITGQSTIASGATLLVNSFSTLSGTVTGKGTLALDVGNTTSGSIAGMSSLSKLHLLSGRYEAGATEVGASTITVAGGQYYITGGTHSNNFVLGGNGWGGADYSSAALRAEGGAKLSGAISLSSDATMAVTGSGATISGSLTTGDYTLIKTGSGTLALGTTSVSGNIDVQEGTLNVTAAISSAGINTLTLRENTILRLGSAGAKFHTENLVMETGSSIDLQNGNGGAYFYSNIQFAGDVTLRGSKNGSDTHVQGSISGSGTLNLDIATYSNAWKISSDISDAEDGTLAVVSNSNVTLSGENSYTGGTTVNGRTLTTAHVNALGGGALTLNGGTVQLNADLLLASLNGGTAGTVNTNAKVLGLGNGTTSADAASFGGSISGSGSLIKLGEGTQELTGTLELASLHVAEGTLALNGATVSGAIVVEEPGTATLAGNLSLTQSILSAGTVVLGENLNFQLDSSTFAVDDASASTFTLIFGGSIVYADSDFSFTIDGISSAELDESNYSIGRGSNHLTITMGDIMRDITWNGNGESDVWSTTDTQENWQQSGDDSSFSSLDHVTFGSEGSSGVVVDDAGVKVASMVVTGEGYDFSGGTIRSLGNVSIEEGASASFEQALTVEGDLTVAGTAEFGDVTLSGTLTSTGNLTVNGEADFADASITGALTVNGTVTLTSATLSGTLTVGEDGSVTLSDGSSARTFSNAVTLAEGATLTVDNTVNARSQFTAALNLTGDATICYNNTTGSSADLLVANVLTGNGHTITKTGDGLLWLAPTSASGISFIVEKGELRMGGSYSSTMPSGIDSVTIKSGATLSLNSGTSSSITTKLNLEGGSTFDLQGQKANTSTTYAYTFTSDVALTATEDNALVTLTPVGGKRTLNLNGKVTGDGGLSLAGAGTLVLTLNNAENDFSGGISTSRAVTINLGAAAAAGTGGLALNHASAIVNITGNADSTYGEMSNDITGTGKLAISSGKVTLSGESSFSGGTSVAAGASLKLTNGAAAGTGAIALGDSTTLLYAGSETSGFSTLANGISGEGSLSVESGKVARTAAAAYTGGTTVKNGAALKLDGIGTDATTYTVQSGANLTVGGEVALSNITLGGSLTVEKNASLSLSGAAKTFSGAVTLAEGSTLAVGTSSGRSTFSGGLTLSGDATINYTTGQDLLVSCSLNGNDNTITKTGSGLLWLDSGKTYTNVSFHVEGGELRVGGAAAKVIPSGVTFIELDADTTLSFCAGDSNGSSAFATDLKLAGDSTIDLTASSKTADSSYTFSGEMELVSGQTSIVSSKNRVLTVSGQMTGDGGLLLSHSGTLSLTLSNAENDFTGGIESAKAVTINLGAASAAGTGDISLTHSGAALNVTGSTDSYGEMANTITSAGSFTVSAGKVALSAEGSSVNTATVANGASLKLVDAASLTVADAVSVGARSSSLAARSRAAVQAEGTLENVSITDTAMTATNTAAHGTVNAAAISVSASAFSIEGIDLVNTSVTLEATALSLHDVVLASGSTVSGLSPDTSSVAMENVSFVLNESMYYVDTDASTLYGTAYANKTVRVYSVEHFSNVTLSGGMLMDVSSLAADADAEGSGYDYLAFDFSGSNNVSFADGFTLSANIGGSTVSGVQAGTSAYIFAASASAVPEPTSSALALLGLGALALRRRRK